MRPGRPDDLAYVVDSWAKHAFRGQRMRNAVAHVRALLGRPGSYLSVAHVPGEPDAILGWAVVEDGKPMCIHYVYVRSTARRMGVARALVGRLRGERIDFSSEAPSSLTLPATWTLNLKRAET